jgi:tol-pal system protein YbgF
MKKPILIVLAALALPAQAGIFDDDEARIRIEKLRAEIRAEVESLAARVDRSAKNQIEFSNQSEALKADVAKLRGQVEVLLNDMEISQKRQRDFYVDLDNRLRKVEAGAATAAAATATTTQKPDAAQETRDYESALAAYKNGRYVESNRSMLGFIREYPNSALLPNAYYWAASSHYQLTEYSKAVELFGKVVATWPNDAKAPDALLGQHNAYKELRDAKSAKAAMDELLSKYPDSTAAQMAKQRPKKK